MIIAILLHTSFNAGSTIVLTIYPDVSEQVDQRMTLYGIHIVLILLATIGLFGFSGKVESDL